jgi:beta-barrel assembly-enhancing protease
MTTLSRRHVLGALGCSCASLALTGCVTAASDAPLAPGYRPASATDEGGLWSTMDKAENDLKRSRHLIRDPALNAYVHDIVCRLAGDHCPDVRVYLVRTPHFNASMAPNGMMQVWSGLLLRSRNEAQLAAVLGHEIGHYLQRHSLNHWRNVRDTTNLMAFLSIGLAVAGTPGTFINLANHMAVAGLFAFNRDQEREADDIGIQLMAKAGYAPVEASRVWEQMIAEQKADEESRSGNLLFATHPGPEERLATLRRRSDELAAPGQADGAQSFRRQMRDIRMTLFQDELRLRRFPRTLVLLERLSLDVPPDGDILFFYGELYRLRDDKGDLLRAREAYERSIATADSPPQAFRGLGLVLRQQGERQYAQDVLQRYLTLVSDAPDRALIQSYITGV